MSDEDIQHWIDRSAFMILVRSGETLSEEDESHLEQIAAWCKASSLLWEIIARIGWEINEG